MNDSSTEAGAAPVQPIERLPWSGRNQFLRIHRIIGLSVGLIVVLIGLSGGILAYREDIDEQLNASIMRVEMPQKTQPISRSTS